MFRNSDILVLAVIIVIAVLIRSLFGIVG